MSWKTLIFASILASFAFGTGAYTRMNHFDFSYKQSAELAAALKSQNRVLKPSEEITLKGRLNVLLIGEDNVENSRRSDTVSFVAVDLDNRNIRVLSLPRDTRVAIPKHGTQKLNHAFAYGQEDLLRATVENFLGTPVHYYVKVDYDSFPALVDLIGGVDIFVGKAMKYKDRRGGLNIDIPEGKNHMNGKTALEYVRFRKDAMGDIGRLNRQQQFLKAVLHKIHEPANLTNIAALSRGISDTLATDMPPSLTLQLCLLVKKLDKQPNNIFFKTLQGEPRMINKLSYWIADPSDAASFLNATTDELVSMDREARVASAKKRNYAAVTTAEDFSLDDPIKPASEGE